MKAFRALTNGREVCTAGVGSDGVLSANVTWVGSVRRGDAEGHLHFDVGGLDSRTGEPVRWAVPELRVGDEVSVLVVESDQVDPAQERYSAGLRGCLGAEGEEESGRD
jgi:hypothetical protein